MMTATVVPDF